jgi:hypothetical protein
MVFERAAAPQLRAAVPFCLRYTSINPHRAHADAGPRGGVRDNHERH